MDFRIALPVARLVVILISFDSKFDSVGPISTKCPISHVNRPHCIGQWVHCSDRMKLFQEVMFGLSEQMALGTHAWNPGTVHFPVVINRCLFTEEKIRCSKNCSFRFILGLLCYVR